MFAPQDLVDHKGVGAVIYNKDKTMILMQDHIKLNLWTIPVGKVDIGTTSEFSLIKEMKEECDIKIKDFKPIYNFKKKYLREGRLIKISFIGYEILKYEGEINNNEPHKHREMKFMSIRDIKKLKVTDATIKALQYFNRSILI